MSNTHENAPNLLLDVGEQHYAYRRFGTVGGFPLVLLQHFRGTMDNWDPLVTNRLAAHHDVILFDNAGVGGSNGAPATSVSEMASHVATFVKALGLETVDLFGFSLGGFVAQQVTLDYPTLVRRLVLAGSGPRGGQGMNHYSDEVLAHAATDVPGPEDFLYLFFAPTATSQASGRAYLQRLGTRTAAAAGPAGTDVRDAQFKAIGEWGIPNGGNYSSLKAIRQPVFIANGSHDIMVPSINSLLLAQSLPMAFLSLYPDAGHGALFQYADLFTEQAIRFLRQ